MTRKTTIPYSTREHRSWTMSRIRSKNTMPEMLVRRLTYSLGYRYRLHAKDIPGKPDIVFKGRRKAIFVHGCFWHQHDDPECKISHAPKSNLEYWKPKLGRNVARDREVRTALTANGWESLTIWECQLRDLEAVQRRLHIFLGPPVEGRRSKRGQGNLIWPPPSVE